ncbi:ParA family protein [Deinococcus multiflagellatus]|uniref:ParA family protein n=1 Tax=Deinococcus multiflagellatus TaxID=1656887 RepID=A0ABW1ZRB2_9DEIO
MQTFTVFNHAGGAGKTSISLNVGHELAASGLRVLLIDLDPQASLTGWLGLTDVQPADTVYPVAVDDEPLPTPQQRYGLHVIPSNMNLALAEPHMLGAVGAQGRLSRALAAVADQYDAVIIDSPPASRSSRSWVPSRPIG